MSFRGVSESAILCLIIRFHMVIAYGHAICADTRKYIGELLASIRLTATIM